MNVKDIQISELESIYKGELFMTLEDQSEFEIVKPFVDEHNIICFIKDDATIYARGTKYNGIDTETKERIITIVKETAQPTVDEIIEERVEDIIDEKLKDIVGGDIDLAIKLDDEVTKDGQNAVKSSGIFNAINGKFQVLTQAEYNASTKDPNTFYFIKK